MSKNKKIQSMQLKCIETNIETIIEQKNNTFHNIDTNIYIKQLNQKKL
jgi:hypothetical protein